MFTIGKQRWIWSVVLATAGTSALIALPTDSKRSAVPPRLDRTGDPLPAHAIARFGTDRFRHTATVGQVVYSPDGKLIYSSSLGENGVQVWSAATGRPIRRIGTSRVYSLALSPDGTRIVTGEVSEKLRVLNSASGDEIAVFSGHTQTEQMGRFREDLDSAHFVAFAGRNDRIVAELGAERAVAVFDLPSQKQLVRIASDDGGMFTSVSVSADGRIIVTGSAAGAVTIWNSADGKQIRKLNGHTEHITGIALSADGALAVTSSTDRTVRCWNVANGEEKWRRDCDGFAGAPAIAANGRVFGLVEVGGAIDTVALQVRSMDNGKVIRSFGEPFRGQFALAMSPDSATLAVGGAGNAIRLWTVSNGQETSPGPGHTGGVSTLVFSPDGKLAATCSVFDLAVQVWNTATGEIVRTFGDHPVGIDEVQFSPDGRWLATAAWDHPIFVWDLATGRCVQSLADHPSIGPHFRFSADGKSIATTARSETVGVWDCVTGKLLATHAAPPHQVASMLTFADGTMLAIERADDDDAEVSPIALWELTSNRLVRRFAGHKGTVNCAVLSPDGRSLASRGDDQMIRIWEVATGQQRREFHDPGEPTGWVGTQFLAFSPDGRTLASSGSHDSFPRLWRLADGNEFPLLRGHRSWIGAVEFSPDSRRLLTGSQDTTAIVWDLSGHRRSPPARPTGTSEIAQAWEKLAQSDAAVSYAAICTLSEAGDAATDYLRDRLKAIKGASRDQIAEWIHQLDAPQFTVRERATAALIQVVDEAEADLRRAVPRASAEARERIHRILDGIREYARSADRLRQIRTLEVLEGQGTPAARAVLAELGLVNSPSLLAREARQALHRLERRPAD